MGIYSILTLKHLESVEIQNICVLQVVIKSGIGTQGEIGWP